MVQIFLQILSVILRSIWNCTKSRRVLIAENLFLRQQLEVLSRSQKARFEQRDRIILILLSRVVPNWKKLLKVYQPDTVLSWWRELRRFRWRWICRKGKKSKKKISEEIRELILEMKRDNVGWGAERIRGELLKLGIRVGKRTIQKIIATLEPEPRAGGQQWQTFLKNHLPELLACDFFTIETVLFKTYYVFFVLKLQNRELLHLHATQHPTALWVQQQLREATPFLTGTVRLIRDRDKKFQGIDFERLGIKEVVLPPQTPVLNAFAERFVLSIRGECFDHFIVLSEPHLIRTLRDYKDYYNIRRPHQGIGQTIPVAISPMKKTGKVKKVPVLGGLHHHYYREAA